MKRSLGAGLVDAAFRALNAPTRLRMQALFACHHPAVLLVTHDVDEAIHLAQRVLVLDRGRFVIDLKVDLPSEAGPRQRRFAEVRSELLSSLGVTQEELRRVA